MSPDCAPGIDPDTGVKMTETRPLFWRILHSIEGDRSVAE